MRPSAPGRVVTVYENPALSKGQGFFSTSVSQVHRRRTDDNSLKNNHAAYQAVRIGAGLHAEGLFTPLPIAVKCAQGETATQGVYRIDEAKFNRLGCTDVAPLATERCRGGRLLPVAVDAACADAGSAGKWPRPCWPSRRMALQRVQALSFWIRTGT